MVLVWCNWLVTNKNLLLLIYKNLSTYREDCSYKILTNSSNWIAMLKTRNIVIKFSCGVWACKIDPRKSKHHQNFFLTRAKTGSNTCCNTWDSNAPLTTYHTSVFRIYRYLNSPACENIEFETGAKPRITILDSKTAVSLKILNLNPSDLIHLGIGNKNYQWTWNKHMPRFPTLT